MTGSLHIVSTKILKTELIQRIALAGMQVTQHNFIQTIIQWPKNLDPDSIQPAIVLTSKSGVQGWVEIAKTLKLPLKNYSVFCLEAGTKDAALQYDLPVVNSAPDAAALAEVILSYKSIRSVSFICGNRRRRELPDKLQAHGIAVQEIEGYCTNLTPVEIQESYQAVLFFSPSAIDSFQLLNKSTEGVAFCLGRTTAHHAQQVRFSKIQIADSPTAESLARKLIQYYRHPVPHD